MRTALYYIAASALLATYASAFGLAIVVLNIAAGA